ncbi:type II toxin-antitoxin system Phd/YefM family antitoxin [Caulobacter segnis]
MPDGSWSLAEAKAKFSEVVERARTQGPQHPTKNGKDAAVILSAEEYQRLSRASGVSADAPSWLDSRFQLLTDQEHDELFVRDQDPGRVIEVLMFLLDTNVLIGHHQAKPASRCQRVVKSPGDRRRCSSARSALPRPAMVSSVSRPGKRRTACANG